ncbi:MAG: T9SS type A sorting domain-containing protein [Flavisolibacter sp.]
MKLFYSIIKTSLVLVGFFFSVSVKSQALFTETFPNAANTGFGVGPGSFTTNQDQGTYTVSAPAPSGAYATGAVTGPPALSGPNSLVLANYVNPTPDIAYVEVASPVFDLSSYNGAGSNVNFGFWINTSAIDGSNTCLTYRLQYYNGTSYFTAWQQTAADLVTAYGNTGWHQVTLSIPNADLTSTFSYVLDGFNDINSCFGSDQFLYIDDIQIVNGNFPLPVEIISFNGIYNNNIATLNWTVEESSILTYTIERSSDGRTFQPLTSIKAQNKGIKTDYTYSDNLSSFNYPNAFYRLAIQEATGYKHFSEILNLKLRSTGAFTMLSPNPAHSYVNMALVANSNSTAIIEIYNVAGQKALEQRVSLAKGMNTIQLNKLNQLGKGMYLIKTITDGKIQTSKLIIN